MFLPLPHLVQVKRLHPVPKAIQRLMAVSFEDLALPLQLAVALSIILDRQLVDERVGSGTGEGKFLSEIVTAHVEFVPQVHLLLEQRANRVLTRLRDPHGGGSVFRDTHRYGDAGTIGREPELRDLREDDFPRLTVATPRDCIAQFILGNT